MNRNKPYLAFTWALLLMGLLALPAWADKKTELETLRERLQQLQREYQEARESRAEVADALKQSERAISDSVASLRKLDNEQRAVQSQLQSVSEESGQIQSSIQERQAQLGEMLKQAYIRGGGDAMKLVLSGKNPGQVARDLHYLSYITRAQARLIDGLRADLSQLGKLMKTAQEKDRALSEIKKSQIQQRAVLLQERNKRQQVLNKLAGQIRAQRKEIATLKRDEQRLSELMDRLSKQAASRRAVSKTSRAPLSDKPDRPTKPVSVNERVPDFRADGVPFSRLKGALRLPARGELMNRFGAPRTGGGPSWKGVFIRAASGAEVRAVAQGVIAFSDWLRGFGNLIIIDHGEGYMSLYSNNESLYKKTGEKVKAGEAIAAVGNSGGQEDTGVYFELRHQSRPVDPMSWVN